MGSDNMNDFDGRVFPGEYSSKAEWRANHGPVGNWSLLSGPLIVLFGLAILQILADIWMVLGGG